MNEEIDYSLIVENKKDRFSGLKSIINKLEKDENISKLDRNLYSKLLKKFIKNSI